MAGPWTGPAAEAIMLLRRVLMLIVLVSGFGAGWLARPWAEVDEAEAAGNAAWRCFGTSGEVHNPSTTPVYVEWKFINHQGVTLSGTYESIPPRGSRTHGNPGAMAVYVTVLTGPRGVDVIGLDATFGYTAPCRAGKTGN